MAFSIVVNGHTYTEADFAGYSVFTGLPAMIADLIADMAGKLATGLGYVGQAHSEALNAGTSATGAANSAAAASASAATALTAPGTSATSTTALTVGPGPQNLTIQTGKSIPVGSHVLISRTSDPAGWWMHGPVTAHDPVTGALTVNVARHVGTGTVSDWTVSISGPEGIQGQAGNIAWVTVSGTGTDTAFSKSSVNTSAAAYTRNLPANPTVGDWVEYADDAGTWGTNNLTVGRNGSTIDGLAVDFTCDVSGVAIGFHCTAANTWRSY